MLPFENVGGDPNAEYLSDGITESIINSLSQSPKLSVRSFSSVQHSEEAFHQPRRSRPRLKVRAVLTGRLVKRGDDFAISAELIDVGGDRQIWGSQYNPKVADILAIQEQISREISEKLRVRLTGRTSSEWPAVPLRTARPISCICRAGSSGTSGRSKACRRASITSSRPSRRTRRYALAYAGQADAYALLADFSVLPAREVLPKLASAAAKKPWSWTTASPKPTPRWPGRSSTSGTGPARSRNSSAPSS